MRTLTAPERPPATAGPTVRGRWIWTVSGLVTVGLIALPAARLITLDPHHGFALSSTPTKTVSLAITKPVTRLNVTSYGAPIQVTTGAGHRVTVTESISYSSQAGAPAVTDSVSRGQLTLAAPACQDSGCSVGFTVTVPPGVAVTAASDGGGIVVSGAAGADLQSGGGPVHATRIDGPVTLTSEGGGITLGEAAGTVNLDSGGGPVQARQIDGRLSVTAEGGGIDVAGVTAPAGANLDSGGGPILASQIDGPLTATAEGGGIRVEGLTGNLNADSGGGPALVTFAAAPDSTVIDTEGGAATVSVPGGPYAVTAESDGGGQSVLIATTPGARRSITVSTGGGPLRIESAP
jgi:hypothetical protein